MTEKDVMVGDWVKMNAGPARITAIKEGEIHFVDRFGRGISPCCEGLPLAPEILEKNGFKNVSVITVGIAKMRWVSEDTRTEITIWMDDTTPMEIVKNVYYEDEVSYTLPFPGCVHELQHALRLCGISKDITL